MLTPPAAHAAVSRAAIAAGKHVYSEKAAGGHTGGRPDRPGDGGRRRRPDRRAPDTFLGGGLQTARTLIDEGAVGEPFAATASVAHLGPESWHPNPGIFYGAGGGPLLDLGPYYVTALVTLLGSIASVSALGRGIGSERRIGAGVLAGGTLTAEVPTTVIATMAFESGVIGGLTASFDVAGSQAHLEIHGTAGSLLLGDPNDFDGEVCYRPLGAEGWRLSRRGSTRPSGEASASPT